MKKARFLKLYLSTLLARYSSRPFLKNPKYALFLLILIIVASVLKMTFFSYRPTTLSEGIIGSYTRNNLPGQVASLISEPLVSLDKDGRPKPQLASWQVNNDGTIYTFKLNDNLFWNDGNKVKSSDIKFNLPNIETSYPDDQTIIFKLEDSFYPFPTLLINPVFKSGSLIGVQSGKYKVVYEYIESSVIKKLILNPKDESLPIVNFRFYQEEKIAKTAFELGEIDSLFGVADPTTFQDLNVSVKQLTSYTKIVAIFFNTKDAILSDKNLRKALSFATSSISGEEKARTPIPPKSWAFRDDVKDVGEDLEVAKSYLAKAPADKMGTITLTVVPQLSQIGEQVVKGWQKIGVPAVLRIEGGIPQNFQALLIAQPIPFDPDQYALWHSTQQTNLSKYSSPRADKDLEDGRKTGDLNTRKEKYSDFQKVILDDMPAHFLYFPKTTVIYRKRVEESLGKTTPLQIP